MTEKKRTKTKKPAKKAAPTTTKPARPANSAAALSLLISMPPMPPSSAEEPPPSPAEMLSLFEVMAAQKLRFTPKTGYNLVGLDDFEPFGEELYLVGHFATRQEAEQALKAERGCHDRIYIYGPDEG